MSRGVDLEDLVSHPCPGGRVLDGYCAAVLEFIGADGGIVIEKYARVHQASLFIHCQHATIS
jgi:hypothetical protein